MTLSHSHGEWSPVPELLATIASQSALHIVFSFANCGTLWDLFCSTQSVPAEAANNRFDDQWLERNEGGNGTLFNAGSSLQSDSLFASVGAISGTKHRRRLHESTLVFYVNQLVLAIQWLHEEAGIVHRDVKPENVLLMDDGRAVICDFGSAARLLKDGLPEACAEGALPSDKSFLHQQNNGPWKQPRYLPLSACETLHGTADYIAPEVLRKYEQVLLDSNDSILEHHPNTEPTFHDRKRGYDASVDWWSFGAMCYEMITGVAPFYAKTIEETYCKIVACQVSPNQILSVIAPADKYRSHRGDPSRRIVRMCLRISLRGEPGESRSRVQSETAITAFWYLLMTVWADSVPKRSNSTSSFGQLIGRWSATTISACVLISLMSLGSWIFRQNPAKDSTRSRALLHRKAC